MKKIFLLACVSILLAGCSLKETIESSSTPEGYYKTVEQCISGLNGVYSPMKGLFTESYFYATECATDIMDIGTVTRYDGVANIAPATSRFGATIWTQCYISIMRANAVIAAINRSPLDKSQKPALLAEACILRAMYYYFLTCNFGDVPFYTEEVTDENNDRITHLGRTSAKEIRNFCIDELCDLLEVKKALPYVRTYELSNDFRIGAAVGFVIAGKMCLWNGRYGDAVRIFGHLEDIYGKGAGNPDRILEQYPLTDIPFSQKYTPESIFEIPHVYKDFGLQYTGALASVCTPMRVATTTEGDPDESTEEEEVDNNTDYYWGIGIPELGSRSRTQNPVRPTAHFSNDLMPFKSTDKRRAKYDANGQEIQGSAGYMAWEWKGYRQGDDREKVPMGVYFFDGVSATTRPYLGNKFWCFGMEYNMDSNNYKVYRFAGVVLNLAEAYLMCNDKKMACAYLNAVKSRAGIATVSEENFASRDELLAEIQDECARELFGEFNRRHDLVRWGIWHEKCSKYGNSTLQANVKDYPCRQYYPIPDTQVILSGNALDNKEYNKYGL